MIRQRRLKRRALLLRRQRPNARLRKTDKERKKSDVLTRRKWKARREHEWKSKEKVNRSDRGHLEEEEADLVLLGVDMSHRLAVVVGEEEAAVEDQDLVGETLDLVTVMLVVAPVVEAMAEGDMKERTVETVVVTVGHLLRTAVGLKDAKSSCIFVHQRGWPSQGYLMAVQPLD